MPSRYLGHCMEYFLSPSTTAKWMPWSMRRASTTQVKISRSSGQAVLRSHNISALPNSISPYYRLHDRSQVQANTRSHAVQMNTPRPAHLRESSSSHWTGARAWTWTWACYRGKGKKTNIENGNRGEISASAFAWRDLEILRCARWPRRWRPRGGMATHHTTPRTHARLCDAITREGHPPFRYLTLPYSQSVCCCCCCCCCCCIVQCLDQGRDGMHPITLFFALGCAEELGRFAATDF
ncbi:hypothetical protein F4825DRAFT_200130 [Nemania diffusa]|nr:hypothetical protein F4825DRAFT_200130 [Nemania diffusa]